MHRRNLGRLALIASLLPHPALAAIDPAVPGLIWAVPFAGLLLSIAVLPLLVPRFWHHRMGVVALAWVAALLLPLAAQSGVAGAAAMAWHAVLTEYLPFVMLLLALFTLGGGILLDGGPWGSPAGNTALLAIGTLLAGVMGTTGVAMVLIHPLLRANAHRSTRVHLVVFFILLCANAGGVTSPLGDPPLYVGFLRGVPFFWPVSHLLLPLLLVAGPLLLVFFALDAVLSRRDPKPQRHPLRLSGAINLALIAAVGGIVLMQGLWHPGQTRLLGEAIDTERLVGIAALAGVTLISWRVTPRRIREANLFVWGPMAEVGKLFAAIFITIIPVEAMLHAGAAGPLAGLLQLTTDDAGAPSPLAYFWLAGSLAAILDNAPTYLVFFQLAGDDAQRLTEGAGQVLRALSAGSVFFGGLTYIGNAPNLLVRSIAAHRGIAMPGFFSYLAVAAALLLPIFALLSVVLW